MSELQRHQGCNLHRRTKVDDFSLKRTKVHLLTLESRPRSRSPPVKGLFFKASANAVRLPSSRFVSLIDKNLEDGGSFSPRSTWRTS